MSAAEKVAISLDSALLRKAERLRAKTGESRSALFARALKGLVDQEEQAERVRKYVQAYEEMPETESEAWQDAAWTSLSSLDW